MSGTGQHYAFGASRAMAQCVPIPDLRSTPIERRASAAESGRSATSGKATGFRPSSVEADASNPAGLGCASVRPKRRFEANRLEFGTDLLCNRGYGIGVATGHAPVQL